ncbi:MAG TPA: carboxypeptidase-like regulatory domain-containing protein [Acetobacteraceae bacterium]|nr:carboxypeptidase-like regulatory domain-containing protein [Acetobacteraceae bacterium]
MKFVPLLRSRFVVVLLVLGLLVAGWNVYVARHDHGLIGGTVVDAAGHPVSGATVVLYEQQFTNQVERARTTTDAEGRFRFSGNRSHRVELQASGPGGAMSARRIVKLWFRAQDWVLKEPLVVGGA